MMCIQGYVEQLAFFGNYNLTYSYLKLWRRKGLQLCTLGSLTTGRKSQGNFQGMAQSRNSNVLLLAAAQAGLLGSTMTIVSFGGLAGKSLTITPELATLPVSLSIATAALVTAPMSMLMKRIGRRRGFMIGALSGILGMLIAMMATFVGSFALFCLGTMLLGPFHASGQYYRFAAIESVGSGHEGRAVSIVLLGSVVAAVAMPSLTQHASSLFEGSFYAGIFLNGLILVALTLIPISLLKGEDPADTALDDETGVPARPLKKIALQPAYITAVVNAMGAYAMMSFVMTATPLAMEICGFDTVTSTEVIRNHVLAMFLPGLVSGKLIDRFGALPVIFTGHISFAAAFMVALSGISTMHFSVSLILLGIGWNFGYVGATSMLAKTYTTSESSKAQGLNEFLVFGFYALSSAASGLVLAWWGWQMVNFAVIIILGVTIAVTFWYAMRHYNTPKPVGSIGPA